MAASNDNLYEASSPQTRCSNCQTVFEVPRELLESNDTRVRCGECLCIFDALAGLRQQQLPPAALTPSSVAHEALSTNGDEVAAKSHDFSELDVTFSDFDLFSDEAELPEVGYFDATRSPANLNFDSVEQDYDQTISDNLFNNDVTISADLPLSTQAAEARKSAADTDNTPADDGAEKIEQVGVPTPVDMSEFGAQARVDFSRAVLPVDPIVFDYSDAGIADNEDKASAGYVVAKEQEKPPEAQSSVTTRVRPRSKGMRWAVWSLMSLLLALLLGGLYAYHERATLYNNPAARPFFYAFCRVAGCELPVQFDASKLRVLRRSIYSHPKIPKALVVNVVFKNDANFEQRYPVMMISLLDITGSLVASRDFYPSEYLAREVWTDNPIMSPKMSFDISLEINDPGSSADSFKLNFR